MDFPPHPKVVWPDNAGECLKFWDVHMGLPELQRLHKLQNNLLPGETMWDAYERTRHESVDQWLDLDPVIPMDGFDEWLVVSRKKEAEKNEIWRQHLDDYMENRHDEFVKWTHEDHAGFHLWKQTHPEHFWAWTEKYPEEFEEWKEKFEYRWREIGWKDRRFAERMQHRKEREEQDERVQNERDERKRKMKEAADEERRERGRKMHKYAMRLAEMTDSSDDETKKAQRQERKAREAACAEEVRALDS